MNPSQLFGYANYLAMAGWLLLIFAPRWRFSTWITGSLIMILMAALYTYLLVASWGATEGGFGSLEQVRTLFSDDRALLAGWVHYLAFDLFLGTWIVLNAKKNEIHHLIIIPSLLLTFFAGPVGVLLYLIIRSIKTRTLAGPEML